MQSDLPGVGTEPEYSVNVNDVINDVRIWRVAINGYPYQSPQSMGLENQYDAFVATKQAIYRVLDGRDVNSFYNGGDSRGQAIKNAIIRLVDIGRNGTQTPMNTDVTTNKVGNFVEDGDYYSQEYSINSLLKLHNILLLQLMDYLMVVKLQICQIMFNQHLVEVNILRLEYLNQVCLMI